MSRSHSRIVLVVALCWQTNALGQEPSSATGASPRPMPNFQVFVLRHTKAADVAARMREVLNLDANSATKIVADDSTNSLVVAGSPETIKFIETTVKSLDQSPSRGNESGTRVEAAVYVLRLPIAKFSEFSGDALAAAAESPQSFQTALAKLGDVRPVSMVDQCVDLSRSATMNNGSSVPFLTGTQVTKTGQVNSQIQYQDVGCKIVMEGIGAWVNRQANVQIKIETCGVHSSDIEVGNGIKAEIFTKIAMNYCGEVTSGKPVVVLGVAPSGAGSDVMLACAARLVISARN